MKHVQNKRTARDLKLSLLNFKFYFIPILIVNYFTPILWLIWVFLKTSRNTWFDMWPIYSVYCAWENAQLSKILFKINGESTLAWIPHKNNIYSNKNMSDYQEKLKLILKIICFGFENKQLWLSGNVWTRKIRLKGE